MVREVTTVTGGSNEKDQEDPDSIEDPQSESD
jgi:hypothetical protein